MERLNRTLVFLIASVVAVVSGWMVMVTWAASAGLYENTQTEVSPWAAWLTMFSTLLAIAGATFAAIGRWRQGALLAALPTALVVFFLGSLASSG